MFCLCRANWLKAVRGWGGATCSPCVRCPLYGPKWEIDEAALTTCDHDNKFVFTAIAQQLLWPWIFFLSGRNSCETALKTIMRDENSPLKPRVISYRHFSCSSLWGGDPAHEFNERWISGTSNSRHHCNCRSSFSVLSSSFSDVFPAPLLSSSHQGPFEKDPITIPL